MTNKPKSKNVIEEIFEIGDNEIDGSYIQLGMIVFNREELKQALTKAIQAKDDKILEWVKSKTEIGGGIRQYSKFVSDLEQFIKG